MQKNNELRDIVPLLGARGLRWQIAQWLELRWWKRYLRVKSKPEYLGWKRNYWLNLLGFISNEVKVGASKSIADMGCGPAGIFIALQDNKVTAVDSLLNEYERHIPFFKQSDYPNTAFIQSSIEDFTSDKKFDVVFCMNAINHVSSIEKAFETLKNICAEDGVLVVSIDAHNYSGLRTIFNLLPGDILHPHQYTLKGYKKLLAKDGWKVSVPYLLKQEFLFNHYVLIAKRDRA